MDNKQQEPSLKLTTGWVPIEVISEPSVILTFKGYAPVIKVTAIRTGLRYLLYISAKSLATGLEELRKQNAGKFSGLRFEIRKDGLERTSRYELRSIRD